ncbi:hypothetical protein HYW94_04515 [Candidatus Uhrbacteria bacterium]|nr:hypothetical protein [Candidatus Uhrbacteria bacterium]
MKKNSEILGISEEKQDVSKRSVSSPRKRYVRTVQEAIAGASAREHDLHQKALSVWEHTSYKVPQSLVEILKKRRTEETKVHESRIACAEQLKELDGHLRLAACVARLESGAEITREEGEILATAIEERGWQKILHDMHPGDTLMSALVPNDAHVSVKHFNDVVFGPKKTDLVIAYRKEALREVMESAGLTVLGQGYKDAYIKIPQGITVDMQKVNGLMQEVNQLVNERIVGMLDEAQKETRRSGDEKKIHAILDLKKMLLMSETSYRMTFGVSRVSAQEQHGDYTHIESAITQSMKGAIVAREERTQGICGMDTDTERERIMEYIDRIRAVREMFIQRSDAGSLQDIREIRDHQGHSFPIMELRPDGMLQMNIELIRDVRKGKFVCAKEDEKLFEHIKTYLKFINILDVIKPFVHDELKGETVYGTEESLQSRVRFQAEAIDRLRTGRPLPLDEKREIATILKSEAKDQTCTSAAEFHEKALAIQNCTYISMDVLDVGPRLLQEFDVLLQKVERGGMTFKQASMIAGDETTRQMREFRKTVQNIYKEMTHSHERPLMLVGGDEAILAMDSARVTDELLIALREKTGSRVVKSVVGHSERSSEDINSIQTRQEHLLAQQRAEAGVDRAKKIERALNTLRLDVESLPLYLQEIYGFRIQDLHLNQYVVSQHADGGAILIRKEARNISCDASEEEIQKIQKDIAKQFAKEASELQRRGYRGVHEKNIKLIIRTQKECIQVLGEKEGEAVIEKFLEEHYRT